MRPFVLLTIFALGCGGIASSGDPPRRTSEILVFPPDADCACVYSCAPVVHTDSAWCTVTADAGEPVMLCNTCDYGFISRGPW